MESYSFVDGKFCDEYEIKKSKFISYAIGEISQEDAIRHLDEIRKEHSKATHCTYGYICDIGRTVRFSDDGEPQGTAGKPILHVLENKGLVNSMIVVVRYFGGIKLGANGLITAYKDSAIRAVEKSFIRTKEECIETILHFKYQYFDGVKKMLDGRAQLAETTYSDKIDCVAYILKNDYDKVIEDLMKETSSNVEIEIKAKKYITIKR